MSETEGRTTTREASRAAEPLDLKPIRTRLDGLDPGVALDLRALLAEVDRLTGALAAERASVANAWDEGCTYAWVECDGYEPSFMTDPNPYRALTSGDTADQPPPERCSDCDALLAVDVHGIGCAIQPEPPR